MVSVECNSHGNHESVPVVFKNVVRSKIEENLWKILPEDDVIFNLKPAEGNRLSCLCLALVFVFVLLLSFQALLDAAADPTFGISMFD